MSESKKPKIQAITIAEKKEGTDIPNTPKIRDKLSNKLSLNTADKTPTNKPIKRASKIDVVANKIVFGKASAIILFTDIPVFLNESLKKGFFKTSL